MNADDPAAFLSNLVGYNLRRATGVMLADYAAAVGEGGPRPTQLAILAMLQAREGASSSEIGRLLSIKKANVTPLLTELEQRGLIERRRNTGDRRVQSLHLTSHGRQTLDQIRPKVLAHELRMLAGLTGEERALLLELLRRVWQPAEIAAKAS